MTIRINKTGLLGGTNIHEAMRMVAQDNARAITAAASAITDSSGGTAGTTVNLLASAFVDVPAAGSTLAGKATVDAAFATVQDALREIAEGANTLHALLGTPQLTWSGGGTAANGTIDAVTVSVTGVSIGAQADDMLGVNTRFNNAALAVAGSVNSLCRATGLTEVVINNTDGTTAYATTVAAMNPDSGTAASPGVTKVAMDANLVVWRNNIATLAAKVIAAATVATPQVVGG